MTLELPKEWQERALSAVDDLLNQKQLRERTKEIKQIIERLDLRWDNGFISKEEYLQKRAQFQQEMDGLHPLPRAMLEESLRVFRDFRKMWEEGDLYQRKHLLGLVVEKVWVKGTEISAITLRPSYHLVMTGLKKAVEDSGVRKRMRARVRMVTALPMKKPSSRLTKPLDGYTGATGFALPCGIWFTGVGASGFLMPGKHG